MPTRDPIPLSKTPQAFALLHNSYRWTTGFQVHFALLAVVNLTRCICLSREKRLGPATFLLKRALVATALAALCWNVSALVQNHIRPSGCVLFQLEDEAFGAARTI